MNRAKLETQGGSWLFWGLLALVFWMPIPYGSKPEWATALLGILSGMLLALYSMLVMAGQARIPGILAENRWSILIWLAWLGWIAVQLIPLPYAALQGLSPMAARHYLDAFPDHAAAMEWTISIDPQRTYHGLLQSLGYFALYLLVLVMASSGARLQLLAGVIVLSGLAQAVYGSLMTLSGVEYAFLSKKTVYLGNATGTFINRNHLAGYLEIAAAVGIGLVVSELKGGVSGNWRVWLRSFAELIFSRKLRIRIFVTVMVIALVLTRSRMGNTAFFVSLMICGLIYVFLRERRLFMKSVALFVSFLLVDLWIVNNWFGLEQVVQRVEQTQASTEARLHILPELTQAVDAYWLTGAGLGNFSTALLPYRKVWPEHFYDHAHNDYAEFMIETGVIGCALLACLVLVTVLHSFRVMLSRRNRLRTGMALSALMALVAIAIHSTVDFNLQIPANAATLVVVMAMINACSHRSWAKRRKNDKEEGGECPETLIEERAVTGVPD